MPNLTDKHVGMFCHLDRLWHLDGDERVYFGLNVASTLTNCDRNELDKDEEDWLWLWKRQWKGIRIYGGTSKEAFVAEVPEKDISAQAEEVRKRVRDEVNKEDVDWKWEAKAVQREDVTAGDKRPLRGFLMSLTARPYPIPEWLRLRFIFSLKKEEFNKLKTDEPLFAAPIFEKEVPAAAPAPNDGTWSYVDEYGKDVKLKAYVNPLVNTAKPLPGALIDMKTFWVKRNEKEAPWRADRVTDTLESRLASAMDLGQRLIDAFRRLAGRAAGDPSDPKNKDAAKTLAGLDLGPLRDMMLAALRDTAGLGFWKRPDGGRLCPAVTLLDVAKLSAYEKTRLSPDLWRKLLLVEVPELADLPILSAALKGGPSPETPVLGEYQGGRALDLANQFDRLQSVLAKEDVLRALVMRQYLEAGVDTGIVRDIQSQLADVPVRSRLLSASLGAKPWTELTQNLLDIKLAGQLKAYWRARFGAEGAGPWEQGGWPERYPRPEKTGKVIEALVQDFQEIAQGLEKELQDSLKGKVEETAKPHAVVLQIDSLERREGSADATDFQRQIAGFGVLMRMDKGEWRCLNVADIKYKPTDKDPVFKETAVPLGLSFRNGVPEVFIPYDNQPLAARSPREIGQTGKGPSMQSTEFDPLFSYGMTNTNGWSKLPVLRFGKKFHFAAFVIGNSGALPKPLASPNEPAKLVAHNQFAGPPEEVIHQVDYYRRVGVGTIRVQQHSKEEKEFQVPAKPAGVFPIAEEMSLLEPTPDKSGRLAKSTFILLKPDEPTIQFAIRKPAVDGETWDRWHEVENDKDGDRRRIVLQGYDWRVRQAADGKKADSSIDDPAVANYFVVECERPDDPTKPPIFHQVDGPTYGEGSFEALVQGAPVVFSIATVADGQSTGFDKVTRTLRVTEGQIWRMRIHSPVPVDTAKFEPALLKKWKLNALDGHYLFPGAEFLVEVATRKMPTAQQVWEALEPVTEGPLVVVNIATKVPEFRNVKTIELGRQLWRWDGRGLPERAADALVDADLNVLKSDSPILIWDAQTMGERPDSDQLELSKLLGLDLSVLAEGQQVMSPIHQEDFTADARAHYFRFRLTVHSRYEGLLGLHPISSRFNIDGDDVWTPWKRILLKARPQTSPQRPLVKIVVPLTEAIDSGNTPPLMVILNESWFEQAGLAERFRAEIVETSTELSVAKPPLPEYGPDPIFSGTGGPDKVKSLDPRGPIGFTYDTGSSAPLFLSSSFLVYPPELEKPHDKPWWYFAKLRFARALDQKLTTSPEADYVSDWTDGEWVQFLADFRAFSDGLTLNRVGDQSVSLLKAGNATMPEKSADDANLAIWVVVTQKITDAFGRRDQERYVGIFTAGENDTFSGPKLPMTGLRARILEVQLTSEAENGESPVKLLFQDENEENDRKQPRDAKARILRISLPIDISD